LKKKLLVKKNYINLYILVLLTGLILVFYSCNEPNDLGMDLLPSDDLVEISSLVETQSISSFTFSEDSVRTDEASKSLVGIFDDPVFGKTTINFASQFRLQYQPDFGTNPVVDSVKLFLYYRFLYGDTTTTQRIKIYELNESLIVDTTSTSGGSYNYPYYQDVDLKSMASPLKIGELEFIPEVARDSASGDTLFQLLKVPVDISFGEKLVNADSAYTKNNDVFLEFFKGLYIEAEKDAPNGGTVMSLEASSGGSFQGSALLVYYNNDENIEEEEPDTLYNAYVITDLCARVNSISHNYAGTPFELNLNNDSGNGDSLIYVQATGGLKSKIFIDNLSLWKDSVNTAINKAVLVFQVDSIASEVEKFPPPSQLLFTYINEDGREFLPVDYSFSPIFYGGSLNYRDYTYSFNITQHLQKIIDGEIENLGFFLTTAYKNSEANRVILKGSSSKTGIRLIITYSKYLQ
jgi:hypothetical protein